MNLNQIDTKNPSWIQKEIVIKNTKCELSYMEGFLGNAPSELIAIFEEDFCAARIKINENVYFEVYCEEYQCNEEGVCLFEVYSHIEDAEVRVRSEYIPEKIYTAINSESELISLIKDLIDETYFN